MIDDRHDVGQALARARAAGQDVGLAFLGFEDASRLVGVEQELLAGVVGIGLVDPEDPGALGVKSAALRPGRRSCRRAGRSDSAAAAAPARRRPRPARHSTLSNDPGIRNLDEAACVACVVVDETIPKIEDVHWITCRVKEKSKPEAENEHVPIVNRLILLFLPCLTVLIHPKLSNEIIG